MPENAAAAFGISAGSHIQAQARVTLIVLAMIGVMSVQIVNLYKKDQQLIEQENILKEQKKEELARQKEIEDFEAYTQTQEFIAS